VLYHLEVFLITEEMKEQDGRFLRLVILGI
jgi:hypothetical protein